MTVASTLSRQTYVGNGLATTFACNFRVIEASHVEVSRVVDGVPTLLILGPDYTVTNAGGVANASVVLTAPLADGHLLVLRRRVPVLQPTDLKNQGAFYPQTHEDVFDRLTMIDQQQDEDISRTLQLRPQDEDGAGAYDAKGNRIANGGDPVDDGDFATKRYVAVLTRGEGTADTSASASFASGGTVIINVFGPTAATQIKAAVSLFPSIDDASVDAAVAPLAAAGNQAVLMTPDVYPVGTTLYIAARSYVGGVGGRVVRLAVSRDATVAGTVAIGPSLSSTQEFVDGESRISYSASGTLSVSFDGGTFGAPPPSPIVTPQAAAGSNVVRTVSLRVQGAGQTLVDSYVVPPLPTGDTDTVTPDLVVTPVSAPTFGGSAALHQEFVVSATNPKAGGATPTITAIFDSAVLTVEQWNGSGWVAVASGATLADGARVRAVRPLFGTSPQSITFVAFLAGGGSERGQRSIQSRDPIAPAVTTTLFSSTATTMAFTVGSLPVGGEVRRIGGSATQTAGAALNTWVPAPANFTFSRPPFRTGTGDAWFECRVNGIVDADSVAIEEQGRDTIAGRCQLTTRSETPTSVTVRVHGTARLNGAPFFEGVSKLIDNGGTGVVSLEVGSIAIGATEYLAIGEADADNPWPSASYWNDYVITRPAVGSPAARVIFAVLSPYGDFTGDTDSIDVQPVPATTPSVTTSSSATATYQDITVNTLPPGGEVRWIGGTAANLTGPAVNVWNLGPQTYRFARSAFGSGTTDAIFECRRDGLLDADSVTIEERGRDTVPLLTRLSSIEGPTSVTVRVTASTLFAEATGEVVLIDPLGLSILDASSGTDNLLAGDIRPLTVSTVDGFAGGSAYVRDYVIQRPPVGSTPRRIQFRVQVPSGGFTPDADSIDVQPIAPLTPGRIVLLGVIPSGTENVEVRWQAYRADGTQETNPSNVAIRTFATAGGSAAEGAGVDPGTVYDAGNLWFTSTVTRVAGSTYRLWLVLDPSGAGGTQRTEFYGTLPTYMVGSVAGTPRIATCTVFVPTPAGTVGDIELRFTTGDAPAGATVNAMLTSNANPTGPAVGTVRSFTNIETGEVLNTGRSNSGGIYLTQYRVVGTVTLVDATGNILASRAIPETLYFGA